MIKSYIKTIKPRAGCNMIRMQHGCKSNYRVIMATDHMVVGFTATYAISYYHHSSCEFESDHSEVYSIQRYVIKCVNLSSKCHPPRNVMSGTMMILFVRLLHLYFVFSIYVLINVRCPDEVFINISKEYHSTAY